MSFCAHGNPPLSVAITARTERRIIAQNQIGITERRTDARAKAKMQNIRNIFGREKVGPTREKTG
jgi:tRNA C32,U32 (ribose-2'-O)-methylase TrmJ